MHYKRWLRTGSAVRAERPTTCAVDGCDRDAKSRGWCHAHYQRWRAHGDVRADIPLRGTGDCLVEDCDRSRHARGYCRTHYRRWLQDGVPRGDDPIRVVTGTGFLNHGYWIVPVPTAERHLTGGEHRVGEHRLVMARHLGRALYPDETVHHVNGVRTDNRLENLQLWSSVHPQGQRIEDKVAFALTILRRYAPDLLHPDMQKGAG